MRKPTKPRSNKLPYISIRDLADEISCQEGHVRKMVKDKGIEVRYFGRKPMLLVEDIIEILEENKRPLALNP